MACRIEIRKTIDESIDKVLPYRFEELGKAGAEQKSKELNDLWGPIAKPIRASSDTFQVEIYNIDKAVDREFEKQTQAEQSFSRDLNFFNDDQALYEQDKKDLENQDVIPPVEVKPGVQELFDSNPELAKIGTPEQYSQYLDSIFPNSKVKDIVYHGSNEQFEKFLKDKFYTGDGRRRLGNGFYFNRVKTLNYGKNIYPALLNITEFGSNDDIEELENKIKELQQESYFDDTYGVYDDDYVNKKRKELSDEYQPQIDKLEKELDELIKNKNKFGVEDLERQDILVEEPEQIHILGDEQDIEGFNSFMNQDVMLQKEEGPTPPEASPKTIAMLKDFLKRIGVDVNTVDNIVVNGVRQNATGVALLMQKLIQVVQGKETDALPEEAMHFAVAIIKQTNPALYKRLMSEINQYKTLGEVFATYGNDPAYQTKDGKRDIIKLKEEAIGKVLASIIISKVDGLAEAPELVARVNSWWDQIVSFFKGLFSKSGFDRAAMDIISGKEIGTAEDIKENKGAVLFQKDEQSRVWDMLNEVSDSIEPKRNEPNEKDNGYYKNGNKIGKRVSDLVQAWYERRFRNNELLDDEFDTAIKDVKAGNGTLGHAAFEYAFKKLVDDDGYIRDVPLDEDDYEKHNPEFDRAMYEILRDNLKERLNSFPKDTRFKSEVVIYDAKRDLAGTIDFLAIEPSGKINILDWKFTDIDITKADADVPWYKVAAWKIQMDNYKLMLQSAYGVKAEDFGQSRMIPIITRYTVANRERNILPTLNRIIIGAVNPKDITDDYLLPVGIETERVQDPKIQKLLEKLNAEYSRLAEERALPSEKQEKIVQLNSLFTAIRHLQIKGDLKPLLYQAKLLNEQIERLITKYEDTFKGQDPKSFTEEQRDDFVRKIQIYQAAISVYTSMYSNLKSLFGEEISKEDKKLKKDLRKTSENARDLEEKLSDTLGEFVEQQIAQSEGIMNYLKPEKIIKGITKLFSTTSLLQLKGLQVMYKKASRALGFAAFDTVTENKRLQALKDNYDAWAKSKGLINKNYFDILKKKDKNELIDEVDSKFYDTLKKKIADKDFDWIRDNINVAEYNKNLKEKRDEEVQRLLDKVDIYTMEEHKAIDEYRATGKFPKAFPYKLKGDINKAIALHDTSTTDSPGWLLYDNIKKFPKETWQTKEWKQLIQKGNEPAKAFYDYIIEKNNEYRDLGYIGKKEARIFLPFIKSGLVEKLIMGGNAGFGEQFLRNISIDEGEIGYGQYDKLTGKLINTIPKYFTRATEGDLSTDLFKTMSMYNEAAIKYKYIQRIENQVKALVSVERNKKAISTSIYGRTEKEEDGTFKTTADNNENAKLVEDMMKAIIYDQKYIQSETFDQLLFKIGSWGEKLNAKLGIDIFPKGLSERQVSINKIVDQLNRTFQLNTLGLNLLSATSNFLGGNFQSMINAGTYFTKADYIGSEAMVLINKLNGTDQKKMIGALEYFLPLTENYNRELSKHLSVHNLTAENLQDGLMYFMRKSDWNVQTANFFAYLRNTIVQDGEVMNAREFLRTTDKYKNKYEGTPSERKALEDEFEEDVKQLMEEKGILKLAEIKDGEFTIPGVDQKSESVIALRRKVQSINKDALGNLSPDDLRTINMNIYGKSFMVFKNWIPRLVDVRMGNIKYNSGSDAYEWGRVRMIYRVMSENLATGIFKLKDSLLANEKGVEYMRELFEKKKADYESDTGKTLDMTEAEFIDLVRANIKNQVIDVIMLSIMFGLFLALKAYEPDDDEDPAVKAQYRFMLKAVDKFRDELSYFYDPSSLIKSFATNPLPSLSLIENFVKTLRNFGIENYALATGDEKLEKDNMVIKYLMKTFPFTNQMAGYLPMFYPQLAKDLGLKIQSNYGIR